MKHFVNLLLLVVLIGMVSCADSEKRIHVTTFSTSFPKNNKDLTRILGNELVVKTATDTVHYKISADKNNNLITTQAGDTLFFGKVSKYRGLYYLSQQISDTGYLISAIKIDNNLIYGLGTARYQHLYLDDLIIGGQLEHLVRYRNSDSSLVSLHADKRQLRQIFSTILNLMEPDTILTGIALAHTGKKSGPLTADPEDPEELNIITHVYPNPTTGLVNIELQLHNNTSFRIIDINGKTVRKGTFNTTKNNTDLSMEKPGIYTMILSDASHSEERIKIVKVD